MSSPVMNRYGTLVLALVAACSAAATAGEDEIRLKEGAGRDTVLANCVMCHSVDYIPMNSPFMKKANWEATVNKMIKAMGAPIRPEDIPVIVDYLAKNYGVE